MDEHGSDLPLLYQKRLNHATASGLVAYCDPHDLIAVVTDTWDVLAYRINGQVAFTIKRSPLSDAEITALQWKHDGALLAIGWTDGTYGLHSGENGKLLSQSSVRRRDGQQVFRLDLMPDSTDDEDEDSAGVHAVLFAWTRHRSKSSSKSAFDLNETVGAGLDGLDWFDDMDGEDGELFNKDFPERGRGSLPALAKKITKMDVTEVMPKLSALPSHGLRAGAESSKFSTQASTDSAFDVQKDTNTDDVDILLVCSSDGTVHVSTDDSVKIGSFHIGSPALFRCSHPNSPRHALMAQHAREEGQGHFVHLSLVDLPLETLSSPLMHVIATNTKRMQNVLAYIVYTARCIQHDLTTGLQFPSRLINSVQEMLSEKDEGSFVLNLYHLAMTGDFTPTMLEWLVDILKETNHKRWDQAVNNMYTSILNHVFMNLMPALERLSIATSTLRGHARFHEGTRKFDVAAQLFTKVLDGIDSLRAVAQRVQLIVMTEQKRFRAFSKWLRVMIEIGVAGPGSKGATEAEEREVPNLDYPSIIAYFKTTMTHSSLTVHVQQPKDLTGSCSRQEFFANPSMKEMSYDLTKDALKRLHTLHQDEKLEMKGVPDVEALLNIPAITVFLAGHVKVALESITAWQSQMLPAPILQPLSIGTPATLQCMRLAPMKDSAADHNTICVLSLPVDAPHELHAHHLVHSSPNRASTTQSVVVAKMNQTCKIMDAKLYHRNHCLLLAYHEREGHILGRVMVPGPLEDDSRKDLAIVHTFPPREGFIPENMLVGGRRGKMVCVVFGNGGREWKIFDLNGETAHELTDPTMNGVMVEDDDVHMV